MKYMLYNFFTIISIVFCAIPNWNFEKNALELTNLEFQICSKTLLDITAVTKKKIIKSENSITYKNYVKVNNGEEKEVGFECIESPYQGQLKADYLVCPKRKYHPYDYTNNKYIIPTGNSFQNGDDFEIKCYKHEQGFFIVSYLANGNNNFYLTNDDGDTWNSDKISLYNGIYDFELQYNMVGSNYEYPMSYLTLKDNKLYIYGTKLTIKSSDLKRADCSSKPLVDAKSYSKGYFKDDGSFYYITYDRNSFYSGYSTNGISSSDYTSVGSTTVNNNLDCPFDFIDEVEINEMNFIDDTEYVYYILTNNNTGEKNYGLIDIKKNKVIYNTNEEITSFVPYTSNQMLAITSSSAYKICAFINSEGTDCVDSCSKDFVLDINGNKCQNECDSGKILLIPQQICNLTCDNNFYYEKNGKCGLCKDFTDESKPYKLIHTSGCLASFDENIMEYYNENLKLLKCKSGYIIEGDQCVPHCFSNCKQCIEFSENKNEQKCTSCKDGYILEDGNCNLAPTTVIIPPTTVLIPPSTGISSSNNLIIPLTTVIKPLTMIIKVVPTTQVQIIEYLETCSNKRCLTCDKESDKRGLCLSCDGNYYKKVNYTKKYSKYFDCIKKEELEKKFYYDEAEDQYKPCYKLCQKCLGPGDAFTNNCSECINNYMFRPGYNPYNNCVAYSEFYYLSAYNEYKPLNSPKCPEEAKYTIINDENKTSCIFDCKVDKIYKLLYNGNCLKECPKGTNEVNYICIETDPNRIYISENQFFSLTKLLKILSFWLNYMLKNLIIQINIFQHIKAKIVIFYYIKIQI